MKNDTNDAYETEYIVQSEEIKVPKKAKRKHPYIVLIVEIVLCLILVFIGIGLYITYSTYKHYKSIDTDSAVGQAYTPVYSSNPVQTEEPYTDDTTVTDSTQYDDSNEFEEEEEDTDQEIEFLDWTISKEKSPNLYEYIASGNYVESEVVIRVGEDYRLENGRVIAHARCYKDGTEASVELFQRENNIIGCQTMCSNDNNSTNEFALIAVDTYGRELSYQTFDDSEAPYTTLQFDSNEPQFIICINTKGKAMFIFNVNETIFEDLGVAQ